MTESRRPPAPAFAPSLLLVAPAIATILAGYALVAAMMVFPLGDLTPPFVLVVSLLARRWEGSRRPLLHLSAVLAGVMVLEWVLAYVYLVSAAPLALSELGQVAGKFTLYVVQLPVLLALFTAACLLSRSSMSRLRRAGEAAIQ